MEGENCIHNNNRDEIEFPFPFPSAMFGHISSARLRVNDKRCKYTHRLMSCCKRTDRQRSARVVVDALPAFHDRSNDDNCGANVNISDHEEHGDAVLMLACQLAVISKSSFHCCCC